MGALLGLPDGAESRVIKAFVGNAGAFAMLLSLAATVCAKVHAYGRPRAPASFVGLLQVLAADGAVFFGLAAVFLCIARFLPRRQWLGGILACIVFGLAVVNAAYLFVAGDQISTAVVRSGVERLPDAWRILKHETSARTVGVIVLLTLLAIVVHRATRRDRGPVGSIPIGVSTTLAIMFGLISMQATQAGALQVSGLVDNGLLRLASTQGSLFDAGESASTSLWSCSSLRAKTTWTRLVTEPACRICSSLRNAAFSSPRRAPLFRTLRKHCSRSSADACRRFTCGWSSILSA